MSALTQVPIIEHVCVATEARVVGYRDPTTGEIADEEAFSSGVPSVIGPTLDLALYTAPPGWQPPGFISGGGVPPLPAPIPIPGAGFLLLGAIALAYFARKVIRRQAE